jgi:hypothetical protein
MKTMTLYREALQRAACLVLASVALLAVAATRSSAQCVGDCDDDGTVAINELVTGVDITVGSGDLSACPPLDSDGDDMAAVNDLLVAVDNALSGCPPVPSTPTPTPTMGDTPTPTATQVVPPNCGDGVTQTQEGETCDDGNRVDDITCPANCIVNPCTPTSARVTYNFNFQTDDRNLLLIGLTLYVRYPDGVISIPGVLNSPPVLARVMSELFSVDPNDQDFAIQVPMTDPFSLGYDRGTAMTITFDVCEGATAPPASALRCEVLSAGNIDFMEVGDRVTCRVVRVP